MAGSTVFLTGIPTGKLQGSEGFEGLGVRQKVKKMKYYPYSVKETLVSFFWGRRADEYVYDDPFTIQMPMGKMYCRIIDHVAIRDGNDFSSRNKAYLKAVAEREVPAAYLINAYYSRIEPRGTAEGKDAARAVIAKQIEERFPLKKNGKLQ